MGGPDVHPPLKGRMVGSGDVSHPVGVRLNHSSSSEEVEAIGKQLNIEKTAGPDDTPTELYKELKRENKQYIVDILNKWRRPRRQHLGSKDCANIQKA